MIDEADPHFALGQEHVRAGLERYAWKDPEHQRRYDQGYNSLSGRRTASEINAAESNRFIRELMQRQQRQVQGDTFSNWAPRKP
jgi:hypothetical protein